MMHTWRIQFVPAGNQSAITVRSLIFVVINFLVLMMNDCSKYCSRCTIPHLSQILQHFILQKIFIRKITEINLIKIDAYEPRHEKTCLCYMWTTKTQISLHIHAVWSAPLLFAAWIVSTCYSRNCKALASLTGCTGCLSLPWSQTPKTGFLMTRLIFIPDYPSLTSGAVSETQNYQRSVACHTLYLFTPQDSSPAMTVTKVCYRWLRKVYGGTLVDLKLCFIRKRTMNLKMIFI